MVFLFKGIVLNMILETFYSTVLLQQSKELLSLCGICIRVSYFSESVEESG